MVPATCALYELKHLDKKNTFYLFLCRGKLVFRGESAWHGYFKEYTTENSHAIIMNFDYLLGDEGEPRQGEARGCWVKKAKACPGELWCGEDMDKCNITMEKMQVLIYNEATGKWAELEDESI